MSRLLSSAALVLAFAAPVLADKHVLHMYSTHRGDAAQVDVFYPPPLRVAPGDTVRFKAAIPSHDTPSKKGMIVGGDPSANLKVTRKVRHPSAVKRMFRNFLARAEAE